MYLKKITSQKYHDLKGKIYLNFIYWLSKLTQRNLHVFSIIMNQSKIFKKVSYTS